MSPEVTAAIIAASVSFLTLIGTLETFNGGGYKLW